MNKKFGNFLDEFIKERVAEVLDNREVPEEPTQYIETDNLAEVIEKLVILHIRMWMLEDTMREAVTDEEIAKLETEAEREIAHQKNRRTVFAVLSTDYVPNATNQDN